MRRVFIISALVAITLTGCGPVTEATTAPPSTTTTWSSNDFNDIINYCEAKDASMPCAEIVWAVRDMGCTTGAAYLIVDVGLETIGTDLEASAINELGRELVDAGECPPDALEQTSSSDLDQ